MNLMMKSSNALKIVESKDLNSLRFLGRVDDEFCFVICGGGVVDVVEFGVSSILITAEIYSRGGAECLDIVGIERKVLGRDDSKRNEVDRASIFMSSLG